MEVEAGAGRKGSEGTRLIKSSLECVKDLSWETFRLGDPSPFLSGHHLGGVGGTRK